MESFWAIDVHKRQASNKKNKRGITSTEMIHKALGIAYRTHKEQTDNAGRPYILRILHVAEQMQGDLPVCAALLRDVPQNGVAFEELSCAGFSDDVIAIIKILTRDSAVPFPDHIQSVKESGNAMAASIAMMDLLYDCDLSKLNSVDEQTIERYYQCMRAMAILENENNKGRWRDGDMQYVYNAVTTRTIDIRKDAPSIGGRLSNLTARSFIFCGIECGSIEGVLQSLKFSDPAQQCVTCRLHGGSAKKAGKDHDWKTSQTLFWMGKSFPRESLEYQDLLNALYKTALNQDKRFCEDLELSKGYKLLHTIGEDDPKETILTKDEFISRLEWLRATAGMA